MLAYKTDSPAIVAFASNMVPRVGFEPTLYGV
jgi:hypothetical protein